MSGFDPKTAEDRMEQAFGCFLISAGLLVIGLIYLGVAYGLVYLGVAYL